ncbi:MAG: hypothetical protein LC808_19665 [Actinobacteria bacterium]|nr:hypothetical protein [Actinomycetota bacterium]
MITIGIDPHKSSLTAVAVDSTAKTSGHDQGGGDGNDGVPVAGMGGALAPASLGGGGSRAWDGVWLRGWRPRVSRPWMCRPSWPLGLGCSIPVTLARLMR